jgi:RimJ/RimL family protein N-acetyltransferase
MTDVIQTARLRLRPLAMGDAAPTAALMSPQIARWTGSWRGDPSIKDVAERLESALERNRLGLAFDRAITLGADGALMGWIGVRKTQAESRRGALGYWIGEAFFGQGYTREATRAFLPLAWAALDVDVVEAAAQAANTASIAVLKGLGMRPLGQRMEFAPARGAADLCEAFEIERPTSAGPA